MIEEPPTVHIEPRFLTVNVGEPVSFRCVATGSPRPTIEWTGGRDGRISPDAIINGGVLRFDTASRAYEAQYTCTARNSAGQADVRTILYVKGGELIPTTCDQVGVQETRVGAVVGQNVLGYVAHISPMLN